MVLNTTIGEGGLKVSAEKTTPLSIARATTPTKIIII
jgi:hypothetical protein